MNFSISYTCINHAHIKKNDNDDKKENLSASS